MAQDYYEVLQVHPRADQDAIAAAYRRLRDLYDPANLEGAADELIDLARQKRDDIERAHAVLSDPVRRADYDAELAASRAVVAPPEAGMPAAGQHADEEAVLDYRPLPPAGRTERPRGFNARPARTAAPKERGRTPTVAAPRRWVAPAIIAGLLIVVIAGSIAIAGTGAGVAFAPPPVPTPSALDQFEASIPQLRTVAEQNPANAQALIQYANALYDSAEVVRQFAPDSPLYQQRLPRWLEASQVYSRALALDPNNPVVRADLGVSSCFYGAGVGDASFIRSGIAEARRAAEAAPDDERVLFNYGRCLLSSQPPQTAEALKTLRRLVQIAPPDSPYSVQARQLIATYETR